MRGEALESTVDRATGGRQTADDREPDQGHNKGVLQRGRAGFVSDEVLEVRHERQPFPNSQTERLVNIGPNLLIKDFIAGLVTHLLLKHLYC